jgi:hypothetical protein
MTQQHPITPPPELVQQWLKERTLLESQPLAHTYLATQAAQWGADQELAAIIQLAGEAALPEKDRYFDGLTVAGIMAARRPTPPSLKEQAIAVLDDAELDAAHYNILLRALEALPDD